MSTPGPERVPSTVKVDKTSGQGKPPAQKTGGAKPGGNRPQGKGRKPTAPVKVSGSRNWGPIAVAGVVVLIAIGIIGYGAYASIKGSESWQDKAAKIEGIVNYRAQNNPAINSQEHKEGPLTYRAHRREDLRTLGPLADCPGVVIETGQVPVEVSLRRMTARNRILTLPTTAVSTLRLITPEARIQEFAVPDCWWLPDVPMVARRHLVPDRGQPHPIDLTQLS